MIRVGFVYGNLNASGSLRQYSQNVVENLRRCKNVQPVIIYQRGGEGNAPRDVKLLKMPERPLSRWHRAVERGNLDLIHLNTSPLVGHTSAIRASCPVVATIHGTLHWVTEVSNEATLSRRNRVVWQLRDLLSRYTLDRVFAVSPSVKRILVKRAGFSSSKIRVAYEGISDIYFTTPQNNTSQWADRQYLLHVSSAAPKKNVHRLVQAYSQYRDAVANPLDLVIAGSGWPERLDDLVSELNIGEAVSCLSFVPIEELVDLYDHAKLFVFPSLHETFGLPNIEAMARGTPVLTTRRFGIPDIVGEAAAFIDSPDSISSIVSALVDIIHNEDRLNELSMAGKKNAQRYSWKNHINLLEEEYRRVIS